MKCRPNKPWATVLLDTKVWGYNAVRQTAGLQCCRTSWITLLSDKKLLGHSAIGHRSVWLQDYCTKKCSVTVLSEKKKMRRIRALSDKEAYGDSALGHTSIRVQRYWTTKRSVTVLSDKAFGQRCRT